MTLRNIAAASLAALALAACGDDDDDNNTKPITPDTPATPEACKAMKCVYQTEGDFKGSFVAKNEKGEPIAVWDAKGTQTHKLGKDGKLHKIETPDDGKKPGTAGEFDLSGEGVTEPLKEPVRGGSNYLRGSNSTFDVKASKPSISSIAQYGFDQKQWNDAMDNFVAGDPKKEAGKKTLTRAMFENIIEQHTDGTKNKHIQANVFVDPTLDKVKTGGAGLGDFQEDLKSTIEVKVKADAGIELAENGSLPYANGDWEPLGAGVASEDNAWHQEEKDLSTGTFMNGTFDTRLYGAKVWNNAGDKNFTRIANYNGIKATLAVDATANQEKGVKAGETLPTAVTYDTLKYVQFGRLSGLAELDKLTDIPEDRYASKNLKGIPFAGRISNSITSGGVSNATDFYFARGNTPTALDKMKALKSDTITYHGQALTYGIDNRYHGPQDAKEKEEAAKDGSIPNSVLAAAAKPLEPRPTLLGSRGNFVVANFNPAQGRVEGSIYNVWNVADILPKINDATGKVEGYYPLKGTGDKVDFDTGATPAAFSEKSYKDVRGYQDNLIAFSGAVNGNKIEGDAVRYDNEKGKFLGAFFGDNAEEMGGVISSAVKYGQKPNEKWGAVFGAKAFERTKPGKVVPSIPKGPSSLGWSLERE